MTHSVSVNIKYTPRIRLIASLSRKREPIVPDVTRILMQSLPIVPLADAEKRFRLMYVELALRKAGNKGKAAELLRIHRNTVSAILRKKP